MNERIKKLAEQAGILKEQSVQAKIVKNEDGTWTSILEYPDLEKFAELIISECADRATWAQDTGEKDIGGEVLKHFGVEE